jgi:hypothetical protein
MESAEEDSFRFPLWQRGLGGFKNRLPFIWFGRTSHRVTGRYFLRKVFLISDNKDLGRFLLGEAHMLKMTPYRHGLGGAFLLAILLAVTAPLAGHAAVEVLTLRYRRPYRRTTAPTNSSSSTEKRSSRASSRPWRL